jgi:hypothetical protein
MEFRKNVKTSQNLLLAVSCSQVKLYIFRVRMNDNTNEVISSDAMYIKLRDIESMREQLVKGIRIIDSDQVKIILGQYPSLYIINVDRRKSLAEKRTLTFASVLSPF